MMPPLITVGSSLAASSSAAISEVVVVLPWVPATAIAHFRRISSPSISARRTTGTRAPRAASISGLSRLDRRRHHDHAALAEVGGAVADRDRDAEAAQALGVGVLGDVRALHPMAEVVQHLGDPAHADAADPDEVDAARIDRQGSHASASMCDSRPSRRAASDCSASASAPRRIRRGRAPRARRAIARQLLGLVEAGAAACAASALGVELASPRSASRRRPRPPPRHWRAGGRRRRSG